MDILMGTVICMMELCFLGDKHGNGHSYCCNLVFIKGILFLELEIFISKKISLALFYTKLQFYALMYGLGGVS